MDQMKSKAQELRSAVEQLLVPYVTSRGFEADTREIYKPDPHRHLFKRFLRKNGDKLELLDIQFEKHGRPKFVLNFGVVPPEGVHYYGHLYTQQNAGVAALPVWGRLCMRRPWGLRWFGFPFVKVPLLRNPSADEVAREAIQTFSQVELWFRDKTRGPNVGLIKAPVQQVDLGGKVHRKVEPKA
jgi:hypothetical protein